MSGKYVTDAARIEEIEKLRKRLHSIIWPMLKNEDGKFEWQLKAGTSREETGLIFKGHHPSIGTVTKLEVILDISVEQFHTELFKSMSWIPNLGTYEILDGTPNNSWNIVYSVSLVGFGASDRDFLSIEYHEYDEKTPIEYDLLIAYPFDHPKDPKDANKVRAEHLPSSTYVTPLPGNPTRCNYTFINNFDLKGYMPRRVINLFAANFQLGYAKAAIAEARRIRKETNNKKN